MDEKSIENKTEQIVNWIRELDAEFCRLSLPRGVHAVIQNGMSQLGEKIQGILKQGDVETKEGG